MCIYGGAEKSGQPYKYMGTGKVPPMPCSRRGGTNGAKETFEKGWPMNFQPPSQSPDPHAPGYAQHVFPANSKFINNRAQINFRNSLTPKAAKALGGHRATLREMTKTTIKADPGGDEVTLRIEHLWITLRPVVSYTLRSFLLDEGRPERAITAVVQALSGAPSLMSKMEDFERDLGRLRS